MTNRRWRALKPLAASIAVALLAMIAARVAHAGDAASSARWRDQVRSFPYPGDASDRGPVLQLVRQDYESLERGRSILKTPLTIGTRRFEHGLGTHAVSVIRVSSPEPITAFRAQVGVDNNDRTHGGQGSVVFVVAAAGRELFRSDVLHGGGEPVSVDVDVANADTLELRVADGGDGPGCDHADWADAAIVTRGGKTLRLDELKQAVITPGARRFPFSFRYAGRAGDELLTAWPHEATPTQTADGRQSMTHRWSEPNGGLRVTCEVAWFDAFPATEWMLRFENVGQKDTDIVKAVQSLDLTFDAPLAGSTPYRLHETNGGPANPTDFELRLRPVDPRHGVELSAGQGRSSHRNFPFFAIETGRGTAVVAIGWSGMWNAAAECADGRHLHVTAGLEQTHFRLHPGEAVRLPRIAALLWEGDADEAKARFRQLVYRHYAARRSGKVPLPMLFCNTCFTRGGGWLNECNAENQISLIRAYAPLGLEALLTDAGWFEGGWPAGAGNWTPRKDAYPQGMGPVAAAAKDQGMIYGLWFEPERVVAGTELHRAHPDWLLHSRAEPEDTYLADFGRREVQDYFFDIVKGFMKLPGFRFYRQDFNMDPRPYWRHTDAEDRQGIAEMKYIEGLYAYWDRIAEAWPDSVREECASGGNRIDLETVRRMHLHQKTDYWFDNEVDQASLWGLSQYLPNNVVVAHLNRLDDYSFHSTLASSLCLGWIADAPDFDTARARRFTERYEAVRHLLIGAWYPLLPYSRSRGDWIASQYHRPDLDEGMILAFRRPDSPYRTVDVSLHGLTPDATYGLHYDGSGETRRLRGAELTSGFTITIAERHRSELIVYKRAGDAAR